MISQYWIGQIPTQSLLIEIKDGNGELVDLTQYTGFGVDIINPDNEMVLTPDFAIDSSGFDQGRVVVDFPSGYSVFDRTGEYLLRLEFNNSDGIDYTTTHGMTVIDFTGDEIPRDGGLI